MAETETFRRSGDILGAAVGEELLMMSIERGSYFSLNSVGARIWELLEHPVSIEELVIRLTEEYDVPIDTCRTEVEAFLSALRERGMLN
ncbi:MAG TPA: PqqD family peptide modification chaperone [Burkholderiales bacterium]|nr:PqqD family peptide modification chaperone [Burkholderiales bacterium]